MRWPGLGFLFLLGCVAEPGGGDLGPEVFSEPVAHDDDSWVFSSDRIYRIDLEIGESSMEILRSDRRFSYPRNKARAAAVIDGEEVGEVGVRLRGGLGSFQRIDNKPKLEIDFNEFSGERFHGLESISLNNFAEDCTGMREALSYAAYGLLEVPTSRTGFAQLFVNGLDYGLMLVLETQDDRWLKRNFEDGSGNFYDGKYVFAGFFPKLVDFGRGRDHLFDLEEGVDVGFSDIAEISGGATRAVERGQMGDAFRARVHWEELMTFMRVEQFIGNQDGYAAGPNNYRVYFEPGEPLVMAPWDLDYSFLPGEMSAYEKVEDQQVTIDASGWEEPGGILASVCLDDEECRSLWEDLGPIVEERLLDGSLYALGENLAGLVQEGRNNDPRAGCTQEANVEREVILDYLATGDAAVPEEGSKKQEGDVGGCASVTGSPAGTRGALALCLLLAVSRRRSAVRGGREVPNGEAGS
jgi:spore coat protein CotH